MSQTYWAADNPFPDPEEPAKIEWYPLHPTREEAQAESDEWYDGVVYEITVTRHGRSREERMMDDHKQSDPAVVAAQVAAEAQRTHNAKGQGRE